MAATREALNHPRTQASVCAKGSAHLNHAWTVLLAREAGAPVESEDPRRELLVALSIFEGPCKDPAEIPNLLVNIALEALQRDDTKEAAASVTRAEKLEAPPSVRLWLLDLQGRVALRNAPTRALRLYDDLAGLASKTGSSEAEWRGAVGRARALVAMKQPGLAVLAYRRAEALLAHASRGVGIGQGRASLMAARVRSTREMVQLLFEQERHVEAAGAARRARMRMLAPLERQRQLDQLSPEDRTRWTKAIAEYRTTEAELEALTNNRWAKTAAELPALDRRVAKLRRAARASAPRGERDEPRRGARRRDGLRLVDPPQAE